jgi:hypothetical protein
MKFSQILSLATLAGSVSAAALPKKKNAASIEKPYAIMDNDWSTTGFIPFLIALDGGIEVLALTSCLPPLIFTKVNTY